jgi:hypothetical protein
MLLEVDECRERYHGYLWEIVEGYFESGLFESTVTAIDLRISEYVMNDAGAYHSYEQYEASLPVFIELGRLRAESIKGQLEGTIPSTSVEQNANSSSLVDASHINLSVLGSMMGGGGMGRGDFNTPDGNFGGMPGGMGGRGDRGNMGVVPGADRQGGFPGGDTSGGQGNPPNGNVDIPAQGLNRPSGNTTGTAPQNNDIRGFIILTAVLILLLAGAILFIAMPRKKSVLSGGQI